MAFIHLFGAVLRVMQVKLVTNIAEEARCRLSGTHAVEYELRLVCTRKKPVQRRNEQLGISLYCNLRKFVRRKNRLIESKAKCSDLKKLTCKRTLRHVSICLRSPPLLGFCLGWCGNFIGSESGQKQSFKLLQNMVSNTTHHPPSPPPSHTLSVYTVR